MVTAICSINDTGENCLITGAETKVRLYDNPSKVNEQPREPTAVLMRHLLFTVYQRLAITL